MSDTCERCCIFDFEFHTCIARKPFEMNNKPDYYKKYSPLIWLIAGLLAAFIGSWIYSVLWGD